MAVEWQAKTDYANCFMKQLFAYNWSKIILYFKLKMIKKFEQPIFGQLATLHLNKMAHRLGP